MLYLLIVDPRLSDVVDKALRADNSPFAECRRVERTKNMFFLDSQADDREVQDYFNAHIANGPVGPRNGTIVFVPLLENMTNILGDNQLIEWIAAKANEEYDLHDQVSLSSFADIVGMATEKQAVMDIVAMHKFCEGLKQGGGKIDRPNRHIAIVGPRGVGKSLLAQATGSAFESYYTGKHLCVHAQLLSDNPVSEDYSIKTEFNLATGGIVIIDALDTLLTSFYHNDNKICLTLDRAMDDEDSPLVIATMANQPDSSLYASQPDLMRRFGHVVRVATPDIDHWARVFAHKMEKASVTAEAGVVPAAHAALKRERAAKRTQFDHGPAVDRLLAKALHNLARRQPKAVETQPAIERHVLCADLGENKPKSVIIATQTDGTGAEQEAQAQKPAVHCATAPRRNYLRLVK